MRLIFTVVYNSYAECSNRTVSITGFMVFYLRGAVERQCVPFTSKVFRH